MLHHNDVIIYYTKTFLHSLIISFLLHLYSMFWYNSHIILFFLSARLSHMAPPSPFQPYSPEAPPLLRYLPSSRLQSPPNPLILDPTMTSALKDKHTHQTSLQIIDISCLPWMLVCSCLIVSPLPCNNWCCCFTSPENEGGMGIKL